MRYLLKKLHCFYNHIYGAIDLFTACLLVRSGPRYTKRTLNSEARRVKMWNTVDCVQWETTLFYGITDCVTRIKLHGCTDWFGATLSVYDKKRTNDATNMWVELSLIPDLVFMWNLKLWSMISAYARTTFSFTRSASIQYVCNHSTYYRLIRGNASAVRTT